MKIQHIFSKKNPAKIFQFDFKSTSLKNPESLCLRLRILHDYKNGPLYRYETEYKMYVKVNVKEQNNLMLHVQDKKLLV